MTFKKDIYRKIILYVAYIFISYMIIDEIFKITTFLFKYNINYNYGTMLNNICGKENFEYETGRFQLATKLLDMKLDYDIYNKKNYMLLILIISILITLIISFTFSSIFFNTFVGTDKECTRLDQTKPGVSSTERKDLTILQQMILCICPFCGFLTDCTFSYFLYFIIMFIIPVYLIYYIINTKDFPSFAILGLFTSKFLYYAFIITLIVYRLPINFFRNFRYMNTEKNSIFLYYLFLTSFILLFYFIKYTINSYFNYLEECNNDNSDPFGNPYDPEYLFITRYKEKINESDYENIDLLSNILKNILGINYFDEKLISIGHHTKYDHFSLLLFIVGFILLFNYLLYIIIYKFNVLPFLIGSEDDAGLFYNRFIILLFSLFIVLLIANSITYYNSYINKYIIYDPLYQYKNDLLHFYKSFDKIIDKDYKELTDPSPVKSKVSGVILIELYSSMFKYNVLNPDMGITTDNDTGPDTTTRVLVNDLEPNMKDATFNFEYNDTIPDTDDSRNYVKNPQYKIQKYIGGDYITENKNINDVVNSSIFMISNNVVDNDVLAKFIANIYPLLPPSLDGSVNYIINDINYDKFIEEITYNINAALCNVYVNNIKPNGERNNQSSVDYYKLRNNRTYISIKKDDGTFKEGNRTNDIELSEKEYKNTENKYLKVIKENETIVNNVVNEYLMFIRKMKSLVDNMLLDIERCGSCTSKTNIKERLKVLLEYSDERVGIIKNKYVRLIYSEIVNTFDNINILLTFNRTKRDKNPLTKYIISNYNSIKDDELEFYANEKFIEIKLSDNSDNNVATEEIYYNRLNDKMSLEKNAKTIKQNANTVSLSTYAIFAIMILVLFEPLYIET